MPFNKLVCEAIRGRRRLEFEYDGLLRIVEPYCHGVTTRGLETLRAIQVAGATHSGRIARFGKLWTVEKMVGLRGGEAFSPDDPDYNPDDSAMRLICCRI